MSQSLEGRTKTRPPDTTVCQRARKQMPRAAIETSQKKYFYLFCLILSLVLVAISAGGLDALRELGEYAEPEAGLAQTGSGK